MTSLGQITGLLGTVFFAFSLILSARLRFLENYFDGLNRVYLKHHNFGSYSFMLLLFHPLFLVVKYLTISLGSASVFLLPSAADLPKSLGIIALLGMIVLLGVTFYFAIRYHIWKFSHKFMGIVFVIAIFHFLLIGSDIAINYALRLFMILISMSALVAYGYRSILNKYTVRKFNYRITAVTNIGDNITEISMKPISEKMIFQAGQFAFFSFKQTGVSNETHPFSLISSPSDSEIKIAVKVLGDNTARIAKLKIGSQVEIEGPFGKFSPNSYPGQKQIWIAGGVGVTPFISMAKSVDKNFDIDIYYCVKDKNEAAYLAELIAIGQRNNNIRVIPHYSSTDGRINAKIISQKSPDVAKREIFICGPNGMMKSLKAQFKELNQPNNLIHTEEFSLK